MDRFFKVSHCDRCGGSLKSVRTLSMFNMDVICRICKENEKKRPDYKAACAAEMAEVKKGNYNFAGIGLGGSK